MFFLFIISIYNSIIYGVKIPVYIEDSHAGSFYWLAEHLNWNKKYTLLLFDMHSDATAVSHSDKIRYILKKTYAHEKKELLDRWRKNGVIQCYDWIEPLIPHPFEKVIWIPKVHLSISERSKKLNKSRNQLNYFDMFQLRQDKNIAKRYTVSDFQRLKKKKLLTPVVVSIDLDYFTGFGFHIAQQNIKKIIEYISAFPKLEAITVSISRPYLRSDAEANELLYLIFSELSLIHNVVFYFEPFFSTGVDRSERAEFFQKQNKPVPYFNLGKASDSLKNIIIQNGKKIFLTHNKKKWNLLFSQWKRDALLNPIEISIKAHKLEKKAGAYYIHNQSPFRIVVKQNQQFSQKVKIRWKILKPRFKSYNILGTNLGFAKNAPRAVLYQTENINASSESTTLVYQDIHNLFNATTNTGTIHLFAEAFINNNLYQSNRISLSLYSEKTFLGRISEIINCPYVFGSTILKINNQQSAEAMIGTDCANFIIYAKKRQGFDMSYGNPEQLKRHLKLVTEVHSFKNGIAYCHTGKVSLKGLSINNGVILHFGSHVAALYKDNRPIGVLSGNDLMIHQLENFPEIIALKNERHCKGPFSVMTFKNSFK